MANAGFVGLGVMGSRMAELLLAKGHTVTIYNRTKRQSAAACSTEGHALGGFAESGRSGGPCDRLLR
jgi:3-hydroxyisobutyrate dehydrogenase-like beta-hydroxyacid dehydrogenase